MAPVLLMPSPLAPVAVILPVALLVNVPMEPAFTPCPPPEIVPLLFSVLIAPATRIPSLFVETIRPPALLSSRVITPAFTAASESASIRPRSVFSSLAIVFAP